MRVSDLMSARLWKPGVVRSSFVVPTGYVSSSSYALRESRVTRWQVIFRGTYRVQLYVDISDKHTHTQRTHIHTHTYTHTHTHMYVYIIN